MSKLIMMVGVPGSGKSTWIKEYKSEFDAVVSRDAIRFALLKDGEDYFAHEDEVIKIFIENIIAALKDGATVWVDATHLNKKSRANVLDKVAQFADEIEAVWIDVPIETAFSQNDKREGRAWVKHGIIRRMFFSLEAPEFDEGFDKITRVRGDFVIVTRKEREYI